MSGYQQYCTTFKHKIKTHKTPERAFMFALQYGMQPTSFFEDMFLDEVEAAWTKSVDLFGITRDSDIDLHTRCSAEREMRRTWKTFTSAFEFSEPEVPPLPE